MEQQFEFIDSTKNDKFTRRLARSHAMKGKNTGKTIHRRSRLRLGRPREYSQVVRLLVDENRDNQQNMIALIHDSLSSTYNARRTELLSVSFPVQATVGTQRVIDQFYTTVVDALYPPQLCRLLDKVKAQWMQSLFTDETSFHCSLALMASLNDFFFGRNSVSLKATFHINQAIILVNKKLDTSEALSNTNLAVVNALVMQELVREAKPKAEVHMKGLQRMIQLRGGISQLEEDSLLVLKICKTDLDFALNHGTSPCFYRDRMSNVVLVLEAEGFFINQSLVGSNARFKQTNLSLQQILLDITNIASLFNNSNIDFRLDPQTLQEIVISVGYRLIQFRTLNGPGIQIKLDAAYHIGLTTFLTTLFLKLSHRRFLRYRLIAQRLKEVIEEGLDEQESDLMLWLLFIGGISDLAGLDQDWLCSKIRQLLQQLGIESWEALHQCLIEFPWIRCLHDEAGKALWDLVVETKHSL